MSIVTSLMSTVEAIRCQLFHRGSHYFYRDVGVCTRCKRDWWRK